MSSLSLRGVHMDDEAISYLLTYTKARLLRFARKDGILSFSTDSLYRLFISFVAGWDRRICHC
jgi:hypothetical protein